MCLINRITRKLKDYSVRFAHYMFRIDMKYDIGSIRIILPYYHTLPEIQKKYKLYDKNIGYLTKLVHKYEPNSIVIDIGANVGDTAAEIRINSDIQIIAIEGNDKFLTYLRKNVVNIGNITIVDSFVGLREEKIFLIKNKLATARLLEQNYSNDKYDKTNAIPLAKIIEKCNVNINHIKIIKIDTDGLDFKIILSNKSLIKNIKPILYFEYDFNFEKNGEREAYEVIKYLNSIDYSFVIHDNYGNLFPLVANLNCDNLCEFHYYIKSCISFAGGLSYFDLIAFNKNDNNIKNEYIRTIKGFIDKEYAHSSSKGNV